MLAEAVRNGWKIVADMPVKHLDMQAAMKTHLSQSTGAGPFDGQHGISLAISSDIAGGDISSAMACIGTSEGVAAITGRETGASARPAITRIASRRRMAKFRFTSLGSHKLTAMKSSRICYRGFNRTGVDRYQIVNRALPLDYLSDRPITAISSEILAR
jgi:hypothetical protein